MTARNDGLSVSGSSASAYVHDTSLSGNGNYGVIVDAGQVIVADSSADSNWIGFASFGTLTLMNTRASTNSTGLLAAGALYFTNCLIVNNTTAYDVLSGGTIAGTTPGTNVIAPGQGNAGTLSTIALQ